MPILYASLAKAYKTTSAFRPIELKHYSLTSHKPTADVGLHSPKKIIARQNLRDVVITRSNITHSSWNVSTKYYYMPLLRRSYLWYVD